MKVLVAETMFVPLSFYTHVDVFSHKHRVKAFSDRTSAPALFIQSID